MQERRKNKRIDLEGKLVVRRLDNGSNDEVSIDIQDVSETGIGFKCDEKLELGSVYEAFLTIWTKEVIHSFLEIVRGEKNGEELNYGAVFIGMPEIDVKRIQVYQTIEEFKE